MSERRELGIRSRWLVQVTSSFRGLLAIDFIVNSVGLADGVAEGKHCDRQAAALDSNRKVKVTAMEESRGEGKPVRWSN